MGASCKEQLVFNVYKVSRTKSASGVVAPGANILGAELAKLILTVSSIIGFSLPLD